MTGDVLRTLTDHGNPFIARVAKELGGIVLSGGRGATLQTSRGELVDFASGGFGHGEPRVLARIVEQMKRMPLSSRVFFSRPLAELVEQLAALAPRPLAVSFVSNARAEALEGALKLVRGYHRKRTKIVAMEHGFHGATMGALAVSGIDRLRAPFRSWPLDVVFVPHGDATAARRAIDDTVAAVLVEPISVGVGVRVPSPSYLPALRALCSDSGALMVVDEGVTGLGRTGAMWGVDHDSVAPDIVVVSGGVLGGGVLPVAAYISRREVNDRVYAKRDPLLHANTTGGNPTACVASLAALSVLKEDDLVSRAASHGARIRARLEGLRSDRILEVAGRGLVMGARVADAAIAQAVQKSAIQRGVVVGIHGLAGGEAWIGIRPPLSLSNAELERGLDALAEAFGSASSERVASTPAEAE